MAARLFVCPEEEEMAKALHQTGYTVWMRDGWTFMFEAQAWQALFATIHEKYPDPLRSEAQWLPTSLVQSADVIIDPNGRVIKHRWGAVTPKAAFGDQSRYTEPIGAPEAYQIGRIQAELLAHFETSPGAGESLEVLGGDLTEGRIPPMVYTLGSFRLQLAFTVLDS